MCRVARMEREALAVLRAGSHVVPRWLKRTCQHVFRPGTAEDGGMLGAKDFRVRPAAILM